MTPAAARAMLDRQLAAHGQDVTLRRAFGTVGSFVDLPCRAVVRGYAAHELAGDIKQTDSKVILSPLPLEAAGAAWPGAAGGPRWPKIGDSLFVGGRKTHVELAVPVQVDDVVVRIELRVRG